MMKRVHKTCQITIIKQRMASHYKIIIVNKTLISLDKEKWINENYQRKVDKITSINQSSSKPVFANINLIPAVKVMTRKRTENQSRETIKLLITIIISNNQSHDVASCARANEFIMEHARLLNSVCVGICFDVIVFFCVRREFNGRVLCVIAYGFR
jgi:hypothetical protein